MLSSLHKQRDFHKVSVLCTHFAESKHFHLIWAGCSLEEDSCDQCWTVSFSRQFPLCDILECGGGISDDGEVNVGKILYRASKDVFAELTMCTVLYALPTAPARSQAKISQQHLTFYFLSVGFASRFFPSLYLLSFSLHFVSTHCSAMQILRRVEV